MPPPLPDKELEQVRLLSLLHYLFAALHLIMIGFLVVHYLIMHAVFTTAGSGAGSGAPPPPEFRQIAGVLIYFYVGLGVLLVLGSLVLAISARCLALFRHRTYSQVIAGLSCLQFPFGTALGVYTLIILNRPSVRYEYQLRATLDVNRGTVPAA